MTRPTRRCSAPSRIVAGLLLFHLHTNHFQLMSTNGKAEDPSHSVYDTVNVPKRGAIVVRIHFRDFTGRTVLHCHILNHEDMGMMAVLDIIPPSTRPPGHSG